MKTDAGAGHDLLADVRMSEKMSGKSTISPAPALLPHALFLPLSLSLSLSVVFAVATGGGKS